MNLPNNCEIKWQPGSHGFWIKRNHETTKKCTVQICILHPDQTVLCQLPD